MFKKINPEESSTHVYKALFGVKLNRNGCLVCANSPTGTLEGCKFRDSEFYLEIHQTGAGNTFCLTHFCKKEENNNI